MGDGQFGRSLRLQRQIAGLTQRELAVRAGVSVPTLRYWEYGKINTPRMASRQQIQRVLDGVPPSGGDQVRIGVLGALTVQGGSRELGMLRPKAAALLAVVALQPNEEVSRDEVIAVLWGDTPAHSMGDLARELLKAHGHTCTAPGCHHPIQELDHVIPWPAGKTDSTASTFAGSS